MRKKLTIIILNCTLILLAGTFCAFGQEKGLDLKDKRITIRMDKQPLGVIFRHLIKDYDVAIGFEESILDRNHNDYDFEIFVPYVKERRVTSTDANIRISIILENVFKVKEHWITVNAENERLEDVLNQIVKQMEYYKWEINDGVVNIFPLQGRDERFKKLLELDIKNFTLSNSAPIGVIKALILDLPEVAKFLDENKILANAFRGGSLNDLNRKLSVEMNCSNLTFRELLNKITKTKRGGWILRRNKLFRSTAEKEYIDIEI